MTSDASQSVGKAMFVEYGQQGDALIARLVCTSVGQREAEILTQSITDECGKRSNPFRLLVIDCTRITFINSTGLGCFINLNTLMRDRKGKVVLYALRDDLLKVFKITKIDRLFTIVNDEKKLRKLIGA